MRWRRRAWHAPGGQPGDPARFPRAAQREADAAFGDPTLYLEQAVINPRHIEVQVLADAAGTVFHLYERDCSRSVATRRSSRSPRAQPRPRDPGADVRGCRGLRQVNRLSERGHGRVPPREDGQYVFIEMNPASRSSTVTEEVTDVDLVVAQMRIASGDTFTDLALSQDDIHVNGAALQCRITTEDPSNGFRPDAGQITVYRSAGGSGVHLDGGTVFVGAEVSAHFDSMLVKLTCRGRTFPMAVRRARRALAEFRIRGVSTNIPFLESVLADPVFQAGKATTSFIDERPELLKARMPADRGNQTARLPRGRDGQPAARAGHHQAQTATEAADARPQATTPPERATCSCAWGPRPLPPTA